MSGADFALGPRQGWLELAFERLGAEGLAVDVKRAQNLAAADENGKADPYVVLSFFGKEGELKASHKTKTVKKSLKPVWEERFVLEGLGECLKEETGFVVLELMDWDRFTKNDWMAGLSFQLGTVYADPAAHSGWYHLVTEKSHAQSDPVGRCMSLHEIQHPSAAVEYLKLAAQPLQADLDELEAELDEALAAVLTYGSQGAAVREAYDKLKERLLCFLSDFEVLQDEVLFSFDTERRRKKTDRWSKKSQLLLGGLGVSAATVTLGALALSLGPVGWVAGATVAAGALGLAGSIASMATEKVRRHKLRSAISKASEPVFEVWCPLLDEASEGLLAAIVAYAEWLDEEGRSPGRRASAARGSTSPPASTDSEASLGRKDSVASRLFEWSDKASEYGGAGVDLAKELAKHAGHAHGHNLQHVFSWAAHFEGAAHLSSSVLETGLPGLGIFFGSVSIRSARLGLTRDAPVLDVQNAVVERARLLQHQATAALHATPSILRSFD